jgi:hypothetical protein
MTTTGSTFLPAQERLDILRRRIANLEAGAGEYSKLSHRKHAIKSAEADLLITEAEYATRA